MRSSSYRRREPEKTVLYDVVQKNMKAFIEQAEDSGRCVPVFVKRELEDFLDCGILAKGFVRVACDSCPEQHLVAFSCKRRGFCPSCCGRRMTTTAAHLVDNVLPDVPVRHWVLSLPIRLRYILAFDAGLCGRVLKLFTREIYRWYRRTAKSELGLASVAHGKCGSVTFIQRFDSGLRLNVHYHTLALDGVYVKGNAFDAPVFFASPPPTDADVVKVAIATRRKVLRLLESAGHDLGDADAYDEFSESEPLLAACAAASLSNVAATGPNAGQPIARIGATSIPSRLQFTSARCVNVEGFSLNANGRIRAGERKGLEKMCRYIARPPLANDRLTYLAGGRIAYSLKRTWSDGSTAVIFEPMELLARLFPLVPPPRVNQIRYYGVLAPAASWRSEIVPAARSRPSPKPKKRKNYCWAELMRRVFEFEVLVCPKCSGTMRVKNAVHDRETIQRILGAAGRPGDSPVTDTPCP